MASYEYIVELQGKRYAVTSDRPLSPEQQQALARRGIGKTAPQTGAEPGLTAGPYPGASRPAPEPERRQEMPFLARAPLEMGLPMAAGVLAGAVSGPAAPATVPLAAGGAQLLGSELNKRLVADILGYAPPQPSFSTDPNREAALQFGLGAAAELAPGAALMGLRRLKSGPTPAGASRTLEAFAETGVQPKMTDIAESRLPAMLESATRQTLTGAPVIDKAIRRQAERLTGAAQEFVGGLGPLLAQSEQAVGQGVRRAIAAGLEQGQAREDFLWSAFQRLAPEAQVTPIQMVDWAHDVLGRARRGLRTTQDSRSIGLAREILAKSTREGELHSVPLSQLDLWRKDIGKTLTKPELISGFDQGRLRHLYGSLMQDAETGIQYTGSQELMDAWQEVRGFSRRLIDLYRNSTVANVVDMSPEEITRQLTGNRGVSELRQWKAAILGDVAPGMGPSSEQQKTWEMVRRHVFESMLGETTHGAGKAVELAPRGTSAVSTISGRKLGAMVDRLGDDVLNELLSPQERRALANIRLVAGALDKGGRVGAVPYTSITAQNAGIQTLLSSMGALGGMASGEPAMAAMGLAASLIAPPVIAKALTNPRAVEVFASPGFGRLAMEFGRRRLSREGAASVLRAIQMAQEAEAEGAGP